MNAIFMVKLINPKSGIIEYMSEKQLNNVMSYVEDMLIQYGVFPIVEARVLKNPKRKKRRY